MIYDQSSESSWHGWLLNSHNKVVFIDWFIAVCNFTEISPNGQIWLATPPLAHGCCWQWELTVSSRCRYLEKMAGDFQAFALKNAELLSSRLKEALSSGQGYVRAQFGVDLGLKPELYPTWVILSTAAVGLLLLLGLSWAAVCGGLLVGKKRGSPVTQQGRCEPDKAGVAKTTKPEEQKKRNKKKTLEKVQ